jgi:shikimate kinase
MAGWRRKVISTGGGLAANEANLASLKQHALVVCLWASADTIWQRVRNQSHRPLLLQDPDPLNRIRALLEERTPFYRQADVLVNTGMRSIKEVTQQVLIQFHFARARGIASEKPS